MLDGTGEGGELVVPEPVQVRAQRREAAGVQPVDTLGPDGGIGDEAGVLEHAQVLRDGGAAHGQAGRELADGVRPFRDELEDAAPRGIGEGGEHRIEPSILMHGLKLNRSV